MKFNPFKNPEIISIKEEMEKLGRKPEDNELTKALKSRPVQETAFMLKKTSESSDPEQRVYEMEIKYLLEKILNSGDLLSPREKEIVEMHFFKEKDFPEISTELALKEESVKENIRNALEKLRHWLALRNIKSSGLKD